MRSLHIIMPMAGEGSRFVNEGWSTPKPLIEINDKPMFIRAIESIATDAKIKYSFIVRKNHIETYEIDKRIKYHLPDANIFSVSKTNRGAVETCLVAESVIEDDDAVIVMDCDLEFKSKDFVDNINALLNVSHTKCGGALLSFDSDLPKYSYAELDEFGFVVRTAEKEVISNHALCGAYFFTSGKRFKEVAHQLLNEPEFKKPEYYVSLLYNYLLAADEYVHLTKVDKYYSYGTPEELKQYYHD